MYVQLYIVQLYIYIHTHTFFTQYIFQILYKNNFTGAVNKCVCFLKIYICILATKIKKIAEENYHRHLKNVL